MQILLKYYSSSIDTTATPRATKLGKVVTYYKKLQPIKSHNLMNTWSRDKLKGFVYTTTINMT